MRYGMDWLGNCGVLVHESSWEGVWGEECITEMNQQRTVQSVIDNNESNVLDSELLK
jgi:hypothetical protein